MVRDIGVRSAVRPGPDAGAVVYTVEDGSARPRNDRLATEEPLEIRLDRGGQAWPLAVTMRTPGHDFELVAGFLASEGIVENRNQLRRMAYCVDREADQQQYNVVSATVTSEVDVEAERLHRHFYTTSSCGVCGKASLDSLRLRGVSAVGDGPRIQPDALYRLPELLAARQSVFSKTGGLHAAALFDPTGAFIAGREDVGRHNALDKLLGWAFLEGRELDEHVVMVSGRSSFEIMQKSLVARVPIVCAVSAPSSLAVQVAQDFNMTLIGFLRDRRFNIYSGVERLAFPFGD